MKKLFEMNYTEMVEELKRVKQVISETKSEYLKNDMFRYMSKIKKELRDYESYRNKTICNTR